MPIVRRAGAPARPTIDFGGYGSRLALRLAGATPIEFLPASVRSEIKSASSNNADASRNGAPGNLNGALAPMNQANVNVNRNGPTSWDTLCTLDVAPCNWPC